MSKLKSPCCNADYEPDDKSYCCTAQISESGLCYECNDHADPSEGYICDECDEYFEDPEEEIRHCGFCGNRMYEGEQYCSKECSVADNTEGI